MDDFHYLEQFDLIPEHLNDMRHRLRSIGFEVQSCLNYNANLSNSIEATSTFSAFRSAMTDIIFSAIIRDTERKSMKGDSSLQAVQVKRDIPDILNFFRRLPIPSCLMAHTFLMGSHC